MDHGSHDRAPAVHNPRLAVGFVAWIRGRSHSGYGGISRVDVGSGCGGTLGMYHITRHAQFIGVCRAVKQSMVQRENLLIRSRIDRVTRGDSLLCRCLPISTNASTFTRVAPISIPSDGKIARSHVPAVWDFTVRRFSHYQGHVRIRDETARVWGPPMCRWCMKRLGRELWSWWGNNVTRRL
jgi:hypothetical protein